MNKYIFSKGSSKQIKKLLRRQYKQKRKEFEKKQRESYYSKIQNWQQPLRVQSILLNEKQYLAKKGAFDSRTINEEYIEELTKKHTEELDKAL